MYRWLALLLLNTDIPVDNAAGRALFADRNLVAACVELLVEEGLLDGRDGVTLGGWDADYSTAWARYAWRDGRKLPPLRLVDHLDHKYVLGQCEFASGHVAYLEASVRLCPNDPHLADWLAEAVELREVYSQLYTAVAPSSTARCESVHDILERRRALAAVAAVIGRDALEARQLPPPVPLWRFRHID